MAPAPAGIRSSSTPAEITARGVQLAEVLENSMVMMISCDCGVAPVWLRAQHSAVPLATNASAASFSDGSEEASTSSIRYLPVRRLQSMQHHNLLVVPAGRAAARRRKELDPGAPGATTSPVRRRAG